MWIRTSSVLLATLVVSGLSLPRPDEEEYKIPVVGNGPRSQYYVLHSDGTFKYGYDTGDDAFESVKSHSVGNRHGDFGYVDPDGNTIRLEYEAGEGGFVARGDHLPKPSPELAQAIAAVVRRSKPFIDPLAGGDSDASYGFRFQSEDHSRNEKSDSDGTVTGSYSYVDENGVTRTFTYRAGKGIGFVIEGDGLTQDVNTPTASVRQVAFRPTHRASKRPSFKAPTRAVSTPSRRFGTGFRTASATGSYNGQQADVKSTRSQTQGDASYSFSYNTGDHSRSEVSDSNLNVDGAFSFVGDDGNRRTINYVAGSSTGFQAQGDHLPKAPEADFGRRVTAAGRKTQSIKPHSINLKSSRGTQSKFSIGSSPRGTPGTTRGQGYRASTRSSVGSNRQSSGFGSTVNQRHQTSVGAQRQSSITQRKHSSTSSGASRTSFPVQQHKFTAQRASSSRPFEEANIRSFTSPEGSYSVFYDTSSHSRSESGDDDNNVHGKFSYVSEDDGKTRELNYQAGSETGFVVEGVHLPVGPIVPGSPSGQPNGRLVRVSSVPFVDPLADGDTDASYNFGFESDTYSRTETADEDGNISGTYTIVEDDGTRITYRFRAGKGIGFETEEISRSKGPRPVQPVPYSGPLASDYDISSGHTSGFGIGTSNVRTPATKASGFRVGTSNIRAPVTKTSTFRVGTSNIKAPVTKTSGYKHVTSSVKAPVTRTHSQSSRTSPRRKIFPSVKSSFKQHHTGAHARTHTGTQTRTRIGTHSGAHTGTRSSFAHAGTKSSFTPSTILKSSFKPSHSEQVFPGFILHKYEPSSSAEKFGYVLKFDD